MTTLSLLNAVPVDDLAVLNVRDKVEVVEAAFVRERQETRHRLEQLALRLAEIREHYEGRGGRRSWPETYARIEQAERAIRRAGQQTAPPARPTRSGPSSIEEMGEFIDSMNSLVRTISPPAAPALPIDTLPADTLPGDAPLLDALPPPVEPAAPPGQAPSLPPLS